LNMVWNQRRNRPIKTFGTKHSTVRNKKYENEAERLSFVSSLLMEREEEKVPSLVEQNNDMQIDEPQNAPLATLIPDSFSIRMAKEKRKALQGKTEFIPLGRIQTEDDTRKEIKNTAISAEEGEEEEEIDAEEKREIDKWELAQLKKAGFKQNKQIEEDETIDEYELMLRKKKEKKMKAKLHAYSKKDGEQALLSFETVEKNLRSSLLALEADYEHNKQMLANINEELEENASTLSFLKTELSDISERFVYYQRIREYIEDLVDCLDTKVPEIERIEEEILRIRAEYHESIYKDWLLMMEDSIKLEDYRTGLAERQTIQQRQMLRNQKRKDQAAPDDQWLPEIDYQDEANSQRFLEYQKAINELIQEASSIFQDVEEDYCNIENIKQRFENWKTLYPDSYHDTYCNVYIQKVMAPFVRLELLGCSNTFSKNSTDVEKWGFSPFDAPSLSIFHWWMQLLNYGVESNEYKIMSDRDANQENEDLVPELVRKVAVPIITHALENIYNPLCKHDTIGAHKLVQELLDYMPSDCEEMKRVFAAIAKRIKRYAGDIQCPRFMTSEVGVNFLHRQLDCVVQFVQNIAMWSDVFDIDILTPFISNELLAQVMLASLFENQALTPQERMSYMNRILSIENVPAHWKQAITTRLNSIQ
jgi:hypothetical protein